MKRENREDEHIASSLLVREDRNNNNVSGCRYTAANSGRAATAAVVFAASIAVCGSFVFVAAIDARAIVEAVCNSSYANRVVMPIIDDCRQLISQLPQVQIGHCYREANYCADFLARTGAMQASDFILYQDPPVGLIELLRFDKDGMFCNRVIPDPAAL